MKTKTKTFDCVAMMHEGAQQIYEETKDMTVAEELAYWQLKNTRNRQLQPRPGGNEQGPPR